MNEKKKQKKHNLKREWCELSAPSSAYVDERQRFRVCGDLDAPEWLLREVGVLSKLVSPLLQEGRLLTLLKAKSPHQGFSRDGHQAHPWRDH
jgi:hypothetical protein